MWDTDYGEAVPVGAGGGDGQKIIWEPYVLSAQLYDEPKTALKKLKCLKGEKKTQTSPHNPTYTLNNNLAIFPSPINSLILICVSAQ